ncbi:protealysin inhibitor emfourin [Arthrobacter sp. Br18]|uniref:protealysin inhibitor emfourin n=1 Tax=Arthrobacter sp. Br18 TaxID=1312954 RepID=UPI00047999A1|nr:protealysin inhibitor emfourin [Arthrobacter sp. Br18]
MKIEISRSGGFAGLTRTWSVEVSSTEAEERWVPLVEEAAHRGEGSGNQPANAGTPDTQRDRFVYRIVIGYHEAVLPESRLGEPWRELLDRAKAEGAGSAAPAGTGQDGPTAP